jgi:hypothetical protein
MLKLEYIKKVDLKYHARFKMWFWRRKDKVRWTDLVRNEKEAT